MAASVIGILSTLGLSEDSTLQQVLDKLIDYNLVTTDELHNIQNISVKPLPNIVRNQADILKQRMYGIATDEDYGLPIVINRRMVLTRYILEKLNIKIDDIKKALEDGTLIVNKAYNDELGNNIKDTYETKTDATNKNNTITTRVQKLEDELSDGTFVVKKAENDSEGNKIVETYETKSNASATKTNLETKITTAETNAKNYTDSEFTRLYNLILGGYSEQSYDTFKEIADYISSDKTGASQMLSSIQSNKSEINTLKSTKANSSDVYNKTVIDTKVNEINAKIDEVQTGNSTELANYYTKTQSDGKYLPKSGGTITGNIYAEGLLTTEVGISSEGNIEMVTDSGVYCDFDEYLGFGFTNDGTPSITVSSDSEQGKKIIVYGTTGLGVPYIFDEVGGKIMTDDNINRLINLTYHCITISGTVKKDSVDYKFSLSLNTIDNKTDSYTLETFKSSHAQYSYFTASGTLQNVSDKSSFPYIIMHFYLHTNKTLNLQVAQPDGNNRFYTVSEVTSFFDQHIKINIK